MTTTITARDLGASAIKIDANAADQWASLKVKAAQLIAALPRTQAGALDRAHDAFKTFRDEFGEGAVNAAAKSGRYDLKLYQVSANECHLASADRPSNYILTGAAVIGFTRADLAAMPAADVAPFGLKRFVTLQRERIKGAKDTAFSRLLKEDETTEELLAAQGTPRATVSLEDAILTLYKSLESKRSKGDQTKVCSKEELKAAIDALAKAAIKK
jgi:hypothetical protein